MSFAALRNPETEPCGQERPAHIRKREEEERSATKGIDSPNSGPSEEEVDQAEAP